MKIIEPYFEILHMAKAEDIYRHLELAARNCYKSEENIAQGTADQFLQRILKSGHESVIEHISISVRIVCDRGVLAELTRHRIASFCLSGETKVVAFRNTNSSARSQKKWTLSQLYAWQGDVKRKGRLKLIRLRSVDQNGVIVSGKIKQILNSGIKETYDVLFKSGRRLRSTLQHKFLTPEGWKQLADLKIKDRVIANGLPALDNKEWLEDKYITQNKTRKEVSKLAGCCETLVWRAFKKHGIFKPWHDRPNRKPGYGVVGMHSNEEKRRISVRMSGENSPSWKGDSVGDSGGRIRANKWYTADVCWGCGDLERLERHHVDKNPANNEPKNIEILCQKCHKAFHAGQGVLTVFSDEIISIERYGNEQTYDIEMQEEPHNFVANGIVVHNSVESTRYANYSKDKFGSEITVIKPFFWSEGSEQYCEWEKAMAACEEAYMALIKSGAKAQEARSVLSNSLKTDIIITANIREWIHIFNLRCAKASHPQMRQIMLPLLDEFNKRLPVLFGELYEKFKADIKNCIYPTRLHGEKNDTDNDEADDTEDNASYACNYCGLELFGKEAAKLPAGNYYANGEFTQCPNCKEENSIDRGGEG